MSGGNSRMPSILGRKSPWAASVAGILVEQGHMSPPAESRKQ